MPKIATYETKATPISADSVVGSDSADNNKTVNILFSAMLGAMSNPPAGGYKITNIYRSATGEIVFGYDTTPV